jgi:branched-subunit amino acid aminotransferase/4-amino-4-deoxychorismate lyase
MAPVLPRIEIDGSTVSPVEQSDPATLRHGHFTAMQVRNRRVRGVELHLRRLDAATRELYGVGLDGERVRDLVRHALADDILDASIRVYVVPSGSEPSIIVTVKPPGGAAPGPQRLQSVVYQRPLAHLKQLGHLGQREAQQLASDNGFDEALLVGPDGLISETASANIGFLVGSTVVWPDAPLLRGITMQLLERALAERDLPSRRARLRAADAASFDAVILANARGIASVGQIDDVPVPVDAERVGALTAIYESVEWDPI